MKKYMYVTFTCNIYLVLTINFYKHVWKLLISTQRTCLPSYAPVALME